MIKEAVNHYKNVAKVQAKENTKGLVERIKNWKSTAVGLALAGVVYAFLEQAGCDVSSLNNENLIAVVIPAVMGMLGLDRFKKK